MWALDPIDGTKGFLRVGQYAVCLAFLIDGEVQVGVMGCPNLPIDPKTAKPKEGENSSDREDLGTIFVAVKGQGAFQVSLEGDVNQSTCFRSMISFLPFLEELKVFSKVLRHLDSCL